jgi:hypothetical protein
MQYDIYEARETANAINALNALELALPYLTLDRVRALAEAARNVERRWAAVEQRAEDYNNDPDSEGGAWVARDTYRNSVIEFAEFSVKKLSDYGLEVREAKKLAPGRYRITSSRKQRAKAVAAMAGHTFEQNGRELFVVVSEPANDA